MGELFAYSEGVKGGACGSDRTSRLQPQVAINLDFRVEDHRLLKGVIRSSREVEYLVIHLDAAELCDQATSMSKGRPVRAIGDRFGEAKMWIHVGSDATYEENVSRTAVVMRCIEVFVPFKAANMMIKSCGQPDVIRLLACCPI